MCVCVHVCVCLFARSFVRLFVCVFARAFVRSFVCLCVRSLVSFVCLFVLFVCLFVCLFELGSFADSLAVSRPNPRFQNDAFWLPCLPCVCSRFCPVGSRPGFVRPNFPLECLVVRWDRARSVGWHTCEELGVVHHFFQTLAVGATGRRRR